MLLKVFQLLDVVPFKIPMPFFIEGEKKCEYPFGNAKESGQLK